MKPFDPTKPYCRRDGVPAKIIYELPRQWVVVSENSGKEEWVFFVNKPDGNSLSGEKESGYDLINISEKHELSVGVYKHPDGRFHASIGHHINCKLIAIKTVTFEEGEGL